MTRSMDPTLTLMSQACDVHHGLIRLIASASSTLHCQCPTRLKLLSERAPPGPLARSNCQSHREVASRWSAFIGFREPTTTRDVDCASPCLAPTLTLPPSPQRPCRRTSAGSQAPVSAVTAQGRTSPARAGLVRPRRIPQFRPHCQVGPARSSDTPPSSLRLMADAEVPGRHAVR
jgi:hypothetical protein